MGIVLNIRPKCINPGCNKPVTYSHKDEQGNKRWRVHCGVCQKASWGGCAHPKGVTPFKTGKCSNNDGHLGFACGTDYDKAPHLVGMTDVDHKNGNPMDNRPENLDELCPMCHKYKSKLAGDHNGQKRRKAA
jgi:hypothetical protein